MTEPLYHLDSYLRRTEATVVRALDLIRGAEPAVLCLASGSGAKPRQIYPEVVREWVTVLGRRDQAEPPLTLLAVDFVEEADEIAAVQEKLCAPRPDMSSPRMIWRARGWISTVAVARKSGVAMSVETIPIAPTRTVVARMVQRPRHTIRR